MSILIAIIIALFGLAGAWFHWRQVNRRGEAGQFVEYFFSNNTDGSKSAAMSFIAAMLLIDKSGVFDGMTMEAFLVATRAGIFYHPLVIAVVAAFNVGYTCDSALNSWKGDVPEKGASSPNASAPQSGADSQPVSPT